MYVFWGCLGSDWESGEEEEGGDGVKLLGGERKFVNFGRDAFYFEEMLEVLLGVCPMSRL